MTFMSHRQAWLSATVSLAALSAIPATARAQSGQPASGVSTAPAPVTVNDPKPAPDANRTPSESGQLTEIVVTARRTNEALQTTPVAVTALSNTLLQERQVAEVIDLARATPSLSVGTGGTGPATIVYLAIRGQAQNSPNSFSDAAVGIYIDGVYVGRPIVGNLGFLDPGSAEVLRGPQGTLFGRNTTGGALNLTTARPTDTFEGYVKTGYGNYDAKVVEGVVNIPLSSEFAARFAGRYNERNGFFPNPVRGYAQGGIKGEYYGRGSLKWESSTLPVTLNLSGDYNHYRDTGNATAIAAINPAGPLALFYGISQGVRSGAIPAATPIPLAPGVSVPAGLFRNFSQGPLGPIEQLINSEFATAAQKPILLAKNWRTNFGAPFTGEDRIDRLGNFNKAYSFTGNLAVDLDPFTIKSITGYRKSRTSSNLDLTGTATGTGAFITVYRQHQFSEELQISGETGRLQYIFGGIYFREAGDELSDSAIFYSTPIATGGDNTFGKFVSTSKGLFAQVNYNLTDELRATGGIRYTWDKRFINRMGTSPRVGPNPPRCQAGPSAGQLVPAGGCQNAESATFDYPAWTAGLDYKISPDVFVYVKTSGASNSGGFNSRPVPPPFSSSFKPEDVRDVEGGFKGEFLDRRLRTNLAIFRAWQSNVQRIVNTTFVDSAGATRLTQFVSNAGKANTYGAELEATLLPWRGMDLTGSAAYLHARYKKGSRFETQLVGTRAVQVDRSGEPITQAPEWTANISATQTFELDAGKLKLHADYAYVSSRYFDFFTTGDPAAVAAVAIANEASRIRGYGLFNGQITFTLMEPKIEVALWGKNLTNQPFFTNVFNSYNGLGATVQFQGVPRTYGATVSYSF
ncbi:TonB-dependent receptor [Sphingomonas solaris]|uniref:TonB-dependent receptor n=1 Tax=Alterirhizorhabdus solaris TaxID=2529389 RepID=A0A558RCF6_9SPHN|nr:TonB-dependent receptor [Sphingomonas solaris]TVV77119.1 TonB-dependent receptor [Sphingomonas solaris]